MEYSIENILLLFFHHLLPSKVYTQDIELGYTFTQEDALTIG